MLFTLRIFVEKKILKKFFIIKKQIIIIFQEDRTKWVEGCVLDGTKFAIATKSFKIIVMGQPHTSLLTLHSCKIYKIMNSHKQNITSYHPQTDGMVERLNRTLVCKNNQVDWDVPGILFGYRTSMFTYHIIPSI